MARRTTGWENKAESVAKDLGAAIVKLNMALMKAEKVQFSLEEKHKKASNDVSKKVKWLWDTVNNLTECRISSMESQARTFRRSSNRKVWRAKTVYFGKTSAD